MQKQYLEIGKIVATQALAGEVRIQPWCDSPDFICEFDALFVREGSDFREIPVEKSRVQKNVAVVKLKGVDSVEAANAMRGKVLYINREDIELEEGVYFVQDLLGLSVFDADTGICYGELADITPTGAHDIYHIRDGAKEVLVPAIADVIVSTDLAASRMEIRPMKGLFDDAD